MGKYREKNCKFCGKLFQKKGIYCCQSCANRDRPEYSEKVSENMRKVAREYNQTPEAIAHQKLFHTGITPDEFAVNIPDIKTLDDFNDLIEGFEPATKW
jgi:hypothetical protein